MTDLEKDEIDRLFEEIIDGTSRNIYSSWHHLDRILFAPFPGREQNTIFASMSVDWIKRSCTPLHAAIMGQFGQYSQNVDPEILTTSLWHHTNLHYFLDSDTRLGNTKIQIFITYIHIFFAEYHTDRTRDIYHLKKERFISGLIHSLINTLSDYTEILTNETKKVLSDLFQNKLPSPYLYLTSNQLATCNLQGLDIWLQHADFLPVVDSLLQVQLICILKAYLLTKNSETKESINQFITFFSKLWEIAVNHKIAQFSHSEESSSIIQLFVDGIKISHMVQMVFAQLLSELAVPYKQNKKIMTEVQLNLLKEWNKHFLKVLKKLVAHPKLLEECLNILKIEMDQSNPQPAIRQLANKDESKKSSTYKSVKWSRQQILHHLISIDGLIPLLDEDANLAAVFWELAKQCDPYSFLYISLLMTNNDEHNDLQIIAWLREECKKHYTLDDLTKILDHTNLQPRMKLLALKAASTELNIAREIWIANAKNPSPHDKRFGLLIEYINRYGIDMADVVMMLQPIYSSTNPILKKAYTDLLDCFKTKEHLEELKKNILILAKSADFISFQSALIKDFNTKSSKCLVNLLLQRHEHHEDKEIAEQLNKAVADELESKPAHSQETLTELSDICARSQMQSLLLDQQLETDQIIKLIIRYASDDALFAHLSRLYDKLTDMVIKEDMLQDATIKTFCLLFETRHINENDLIDRLPAKDKLTANCLWLDRIWFFYAKWQKDLSEHPEKTSKLLIEKIHKPLIKSFVYKFSFFYEDLSHAKPYLEKFKIFELWDASEKINFLYDVMRTYFDDNRLDDLSLHHAILELASDMSLPNVIQLIQDLQHEFFEKNIRDEEDKDVIQQLKNACSSWTKQIIDVYISQSPHLTKQEIDYQQLSTIWYHADILEQMKQELFKAIIKHRQYVDQLWQQEFDCLLEYFKRNTCRTPLMLAMLQSSDQFVVTNIDQFISDEQATAVLDLLFQAIENASDEENSESIKHCLQQLILFYDKFMEKKIRPALLTVEITTDLQMVDPYFDVLNKIHQANADRQVISLVIELKKIISFFFRYTYPSKLKKMTYSENKSLHMETVAELLSKNLDRLDHPFMSRIFFKLTIDFVLSDLIALVKQLNESMKIDLNKNLSQLITRKLIKLVAKQQIDLSSPHEQHDDEFVLPIGFDLSDALKAISAACIKENTVVPPPTFVTAVGELIDQAKRNQHQPLTGTPLYQLLNDDTLPFIKVLILEAHCLQLGDMQAMWEYALDSTSLEDMPFFNQLLTMPYFSICFSRLDCLLQAFPKGDPDDYENTYYNFLSNLSEIYLRESFKNGSLVHIKHQLNLLHLIFTYGWPDESQVELLRQIRTAYPKQCGNQIQKLFDLFNNQAESPSPIYLTESFCPSRASSLSI